MEQNFKTITNSHLGYNLAGRQHEITSDFKVDSYIWWNTGYAVTLSLERSMRDVRIACGTITVKGAFGHISERKFCEVGRLNEITFFSFFYVTSSSKRTFLRLPLVHVQKSGVLALLNWPSPILPYLSNACQAGCQCLK